MFLPLTCLTLIGSCIFCKVLNIVFSPKKYKQLVTPVASLHSVSVKFAIKSNLSMYYFKPR